MIKRQRIPASTYLNISGRNNKSTWDKFQDFYRWMLDNDIFPLRHMGGVRGANEFGGAFTDEDLPKVEAKLKELGIK